MNYILIGKFVNTHGIKGELKILSSFQYKEKVFKKDMIIYIGNDKIKEIINSYRHHKIFDMVTLKGYNNINEILKYKGLDVYINKQDLKLDKDKYLDSDLIGFSVIIDDKIIGVISNFENHSLNKIIIVKNDEKEFLIPYSSDIIKSIDTEKRIITINNIKGLI